MGVRFPSLGASSTTVVAINSTAETAAVTSSPFTPALDLAQIFVFWYVFVLTGAGTTAVQVRLKRGLLGGTLLNTGTGLTAGAVVNTIISGFWIDSPGSVSGVQYTVTVQQTAATGNGQVNEASILVMSL